MGADDVLLVRDELLDGLIEGIVVSISRQGSVFGSQGIAVKVQRIVRNMASGFLVVVVVVLSVQVDDQVAPIVIDFNFYGLGCELIFDFYKSLRFWLETEAFPRLLPKKGIVGPWPGVFLRLKVATSLSRSRKLAIQLIPARRWKDVSANRRAGQYTPKPKKDSLSKRS